MLTPIQIRQKITAEIIASLDQGLRPWRRPWSADVTAGRPANVLSRKVYSGINPILLDLHATKHGFASRHWGTYRQWQEVGGTVARRPDHVRSGEWGAQIVFYRPITKTVVDPDTQEETASHFPLLRSFTVFNADQVEGESIQRFKSATPAEQSHAVPNFAPAEELIVGTAAKIEFGGDSAFYRREDDSIRIPPKHRFNPPGAYYETILHELAHWSEVRLSWDHTQHGYAMGELVAEIAASFLATELGVPQGESLENHSAYLKSWLEAMKGDSTFIFKASTQASKVTDFLLSFVHKTEPVVAV